jgi:AbrB family looped-hinge helix DNA binding protein
MQLASVTRKGQVTIPKRLRKKYNIPLNGKVRFEEGNEFIKVKPVETNILDLAGFVKRSKGKSALKAREEMGKKYKRV